MSVFKKRKCPMIWSASVHKKAQMSYEKALVEHTALKDWYYCLISDIRYFYQSNNSLIIRIRWCNDIQWQNSIYTTSGYLWQRCFLTVTYMNSNILCNMYFMFPSLKQEILSFSLKIFQVSPLLQYNHWFLGTIVLR